MKRKQRVLLVDQDPGWESFCRKVLQARGYELDISSHLEPYRNELVLGLYDIVLVPIFAPGYGHLALLRETLELSPTCNVVVTANAPMAADIADAYFLGACRCLRKDYTPSSLTSVLPRASTFRNAYTRKEDSDA